MYRTKQEILEGVENIETAKKVDRNTYEILFKDGSRAIRLHLTNVVTFTPNGDAILNSGRWQTPTTRDRINKHIPFYVSQRKKVWYVDVDGVEYTFNDGMRITKRHKVYGAGKSDKLLKLDKQIGTYVDGYIKKLTERKLSKPSGADCWFCYLGNDEGSLGEQTGDKDHLIMHIKQKYYVPSLMVRATKQTPVSPIAQHCLGYWFGYHNESVKNFESIAKDQVRTSLKRYMRSQLGLCR